MTGCRLLDDSTTWYKNAAGAHVQAEPVPQTGMAAGDTGDMLTIKSDDTVHPRTLVGTGGITVTVNDDDITVDGSGVSGSGSGGGGGTPALMIPVGDETTDLTTGTAKLTFRMPFAMTLSAVRASVTTAPTGAALQVDINEAGSSILSTVLSIDAGEETSTTAATPAVISDTALADDAEITIDIDQVGSTIAGAGLKVYLIGETGAGGSAPDWLLKQPGALPDTPDDADDHFEVGTSLDTAGTRRSGATAWQKTNWGTATEDIVDGVLRIMIPATSSTNLRIAEQAVSGTTWTYRARVGGYSVDTNFSTFGMVLRESSGGKILTIHSNIAAHTIESNRWNSVSSYNSSSSTVSLSNWWTTMDWRWYEVKYDGTNLVLSWSPTGVDGSFVAMRTETPATFLGATPTHVGLFANVDTNAHVVHCYCDVFLKVA